MSHIVASDLAYAHPGGELLFDDVSFRIGPGQHVGLVGANGVGKSTLMRILAGELTADEGQWSLGGLGAYMPQDVGVARKDDELAVYELLLSLAPAALRRAGRQVRDSEAQLRGRDHDAGARLRAAIGDRLQIDQLVAPFSDEVHFGERVGAGGFEAAMAALARYGLLDAARRSCDLLSGGEKARLEVLLLECSRCRVTSRRARRCWSRNGRQRPASRERFGRRGLVPWDPRDRSGTDRPQPPTTRHSGA